MLISLLLAPALAFGGSGPDKAKLRDLIDTPGFSANFSTDIDFERRLGFVLGRRDWAADISAAKASLKAGPSDAERLFGLGDLYFAAGDSKASDASYAEAEKAFRARFAKHPKDADLAARLALALIETGKRDESEKVLKKALSLDPGSWRALDAMGQLMERRVTIMVMEGRNVVGRQFCAVVAQRKLTPQGLAKAADLYAQARRYHDQAVAAAPREKEAYVGRMFGSVISGVFSSCAAHGASSQMDTSREFTMALLEPGVLADLDRIAELDPSDDRLPEAAVFLDIEARLSGGGGTDKNLDAEYALLEKFADGRDRTKAAAAARVLGTARAFDFVSRGRGAAEAEKALRRAISLDPSPEEPWNFMFALLTKQGRSKDLKTAVEESLKTSDTSYRRMILAMASVRLKDWKQAESQARKAVAMAPDDPKAHWMLGTALLKSGDAEGTEAKSELDRAAEFSGALDADDRGDLAIVRAAQAGLAGDAAGARKILSEAQKDSPQLDVSAVRAALGLE